MSLNREDAAEDWYQHRLASGRAEPATRQMRMYLDRDILPAIGHKQINAVSRQDCVGIQSAIETRGARAIAAKVRVWLNQIFSRAIAQGHCELNPASELKQVALPSQEQQYPHLLEADLPDFLKTLSESKAQQLALTATWMLLRTATRPGMVRMAEWSEIDLGKGLWSIPATRMKTKVDYVCPLSTQVIDDLKLLHQRAGRSKYLLPGTRSSACMSDGTINKVISSVGYKGRLVGHGSRHTASTLLHEHGFEHAHIEAQLSHAVKGVAGVYNKASYLKQRRKMMQWYSDYLDSLNPTK